LTLTQIFVFAALGLLTGRMYKIIGRGWLLFAVSALAVFWLQPAALIRNFDFYLPLFSLALAGWVWALTAPKEYKPGLQDALAAALLAGVALIISLTRYFDVLCCVTASRPPQIGTVAILVVAHAALGWAAVRFGRGGRGWLLNAATLLILGVLVVLKAPALALRANGLLRGLSGQDASLASSLDIGWLGFSYIAFRLVHALRDRVAGRLPAISLRDFVTYIVFFPALAAGPIDRVERFAPQLERPYRLDNDALLAASRRLFTGLFMKFVLADALAVFALNAANAQQTQASGWMWVLLFAYSLRIFFDFAGYTHIAIGLGLLFGVLLPENFDRPYLKPNITAFWNSWHITLAQWFRSYFFNPLTRALRTRNWPVWAVILIAQLSTMALIGLWHGITLNFLIWGLWHGAGLFLHNQWTQFVKTRPINLSARISRPLSIAATFLFVSLGWVWFALPQPADALHALRVLFGMG
jgi:D-alanyl-lipoteichoic acid acyltransferase DltB (MBOAT superfamily)